MQTHRFPPLVRSGSGSTLSDGEAAPLEPDDRIELGAAQQPDLEMQALLPLTPPHPPHPPHQDGQQEPAPAPDEVEPQNPALLAPQVEGDDAENPNPAQQQSDLTYALRAMGLVAGMGAGVGFGIGHGWADDQPVLALPPALLAGGVGLREGLPRTGGGILMGVSVGQVFAHVADFVAPESREQARAVGQVLGFGLGVRLSALYFR